MLNKKLVEIVINQYQQKLNGIHGISHWARVLENGRKLTETTGANLKVVELFSIFHDSKRCTESIDKNHGLRGADYAKSLFDLSQKPLFDISNEDFDLLYTACKLHTDGLTEADVTIQTCWDSDRLDLGRVYINPKITYLCTDAAKSSETIKWAYKRSRKYFEPELIEKEWDYNISK